MYSLDYAPENYQITSNHLSMEGPGGRGTTGEEANTVNASDGTAGNEGSFAEVTAPPDLNSEESLIHGSVIDTTEDRQTRKPLGQVFDE